jgi:vitamin B12/bleomycin/antimicrobial peptide transport system ATP-binding/permease protein
MTDHAPPAPEAQGFNLDARIVKAFGRFAGAFWTGATARRAWFLTAALATCLVLSTYATVALNEWNRIFFDALEKRDLAAFQAAVLQFPIIIAGMAAVGVGIVLARETLQVRWRQWLVEKLLDRWLDKQRFYHMNVSGLEPPNPEYRISDDTRWATEVVVDLGIGLFSAVIGGIAFISILWQVGGSYTLGGVTIPAYMVVLALAYGITASLIMLWIGRPLVGRVGRKNESEGYFRFAMMRLRDNAESIALMNGAQHEKVTLGRFYDQVVGRWLEIVRSHGHVTWITNASGPMIPIIPLLFAAPKYLAGDLTLGQVTQLAAAFVQVQIAISWLVDNYNRIAEWYASARRVMDIVHASDATDALIAKGNGRLTESVAGTIAAEKLEIFDAGGKRLLAPLDLAIKPGESLYIAGDSGLGKSTLVRVLTGLASPASGKVSVPKSSRIMVTPQKSYVPLGTLRDVLSYPVANYDASDAEIQAAMTAVGLEDMIGRIDELARWDQLLSGGERQRIAIARLLVHRPDVVILDDALSALEETAQTHVWRALRDGLKGATVISLGQRLVKDGLYDRQLILTRDERGAVLRPAKVLELV